MTITKLAAFAAIVTTVSAVSDPLEFGEYGRSLRNRNIFDKLLRRQTTVCPLSTECNFGMTCCGIYCCYMWGTCVGNTETEKSCTISTDSSSFDFNTDFNSTATSDMINTYLDSLSSSLDNLPTPTPFSLDDDTMAGTPSESSSSSSLSFSSASNTAEPTPFWPDGPTDTSSDFSTSSTNKGFASWSKGAKAGVIIGAITGVSLLGALIWWVAFMTCCRKRHKVQKVSDLRPPTQFVPPPPPPPVMSPPPTYASPPIPDHPELGGGDDAYGGYKASVSHVQNPAAAPKFDPATGTYQTVGHGVVHEAPEGQRQ